MVSLMATAGVLLTLGPFKGLDTTSIGPYVDPTNAITATNANPHRFPSALTNELGRVNVTTISAGVGAAISAIAPYIPSSSDQQMIVCTLLSGTPSMFMYDPATASQTQLETAIQFDQAIQYGGVLYTNGGQQYSSANPANLYSWQYPPPDGVALSYSVSQVSGSSLIAATYAYAFTQVVTAPNSGFTQETSATGDDTPFPYSVTLTSSGNIQISGTFAGTNADGSTFVTNVYRQSTNSPIFLLLTQLTVNTPYTDTTPDSGIQGNPQLLVADPPPVSSTNRGAITLHKERMWVYVLVQNAATNNLPQAQLWYSAVGQPWVFDEVNQVLLVNNSAIPSSPAYTGYGDVPVGLASTSSFLMAFCERSSWVTYGDDETTFIARKLFTIGCQSRYSITVGEENVYWLSESGAYLFNGAAPQYISEPIRNTLFNLSASDRQAAVGTYANKTWYLSFPTLNQTYAYWTQTGDWFGPLAYGTNAAYFVPANPATYGNASQINEVTAARTGTTFIDAWFAGGEVDLGSPQGVTWTSALTDSGHSEAEKEYSFIGILAPIQTGFATVTLTIDPGTNPAKTYSWVFDLSAQTTRQLRSVPPDFRGFMAQLSVTFNSIVDASQPLIIYRVFAGGVLGRSWVQNAS